MTLHVSVNGFNRSNGEQCDILAASSPPKGNAPTAATVEALNFSKPFAKKEN